ncbi:MAG: MmgE/PrpD family protein [Pseudomonadota bacterium]
MDTPSVTVIETFAEFAAGANPSGLPVISAKRCLLDWTGAAIAGGNEMPAAALQRAFTGPGHATLIPGGALRDTRTAALINGAASHTVEVDDIYRAGLFHPGVVVIPAALAVAQAEGRSGNELLRAIIAGYEVSNRIARVVNPAHYRFWHTTGTIGHLGAAVASGAAMGLPAGQLAHAMATATTFAAGLRHAFSTDAMSKPLHAGRAAEAGVAAAIMARNGVTGVLDILEGPLGLGVATAGAPDWGEATLSLGQEWTIVDTTPKAHACCGHNFAALDATRMLVLEHRIAPDTIDEIEVATYRAAVEICGKGQPASAAEARFSLPWCVALIALHGSVTPAGFSASALADPGVRALAARVRLREDAQAEELFPQARSATVTLRSNGATFSLHRPTRKGDPDDPMTSGDLTAKYRALADPVIGAEAARRLQKDIEDVDTAPTVRHLMKR